MDSSTTSPPSSARRATGLPAPGGDDDDLALMRLLLETEHLDAFLGGLTSAVAARMGGTVACGILVQRGRRALAVAGSDAVASAAEELEHAHGGGPTRHALRSGSVVTVEDMSDEPRWVGYAAQAVDRGVRSALTIPMTLDSGTAGVLSLYSPVTRGLTDLPTIARAAACAEQAGAALGLALRQSHHGEVADQLRQAMSTRTVIDQAIGVLMSQQHCSADVAFGILRSASQNRNQKLRDIAADVVAAVSGPVVATAPAATGAHPG